VRPGLGLGLTVATIFCRTHGGYLMVNSAFGEGTGITMTFPAGDSGDALPLRESAAQYLTDPHSCVYVELCDIAALPR